MAQCRTNVMGQRWADEQTLRWPIQDLQPWANRAASDGPMKGQCIRAIWACPWPILLLRTRNGNKIISERFHQFLIQLAHAQSEQNSEHEELKENI